MRDSSHAIRERLNTIQDLSRSLTMRLPTFHSNDNRKRAAKVAEPNAAGQEKQLRFQLAQQIKILVDTPEQIWR
jgi:hypothetical protein